MRRLVSYALLAAGLLGFAGAAARAQLVEDYRFKGKVLDAEGKPIADVNILLKDLATSAQYQFKSHADGTFDRRMIPHGIYEATFSKPGYLSRSQKFDWSVPPSQVETIEVKVVLESQAAHAGVSARLRRKLDVLAGKVPAPAAAPRVGEGPVAEPLPLFPEDGGHQETRETAGLVTACA